MYLRSSFDPDFDSLMLHLESKHGKELFDIDGIGKQTDINEFSKQFFTNKSNVADVSVDSNANVDNKDMISYNVELPKSMFRMNAYYLLWKKMRQLYGRDEANRVIEKQLIGDIYINDFHGIQQPYCFNYSTYDIALEGLKMVHKIKSVAPKYLTSFKSQLEQFTMIASNSTLGATGLADMLIVMSYYVDKIFRTGYDSKTFFDGWFSDSEKEEVIGYLDQLPGFKQDGKNDHSISKKVKEINQVIDKNEPVNPRFFSFNVYRYVKETIASFIYTINQPGRSGLQSPFTNVSIYDDVFLDKLVDDYAFIEEDGEVYTPDKDTVRKVQELFIDCMNEELERTPVTFPVTTACFATKEPGKDVEDWVVEKYGVDNSRQDRFIIDTNFRRFISEKNLKWGFINIYQGDSSTLSSCCFEGNEVIEVFNKDTEMKEVMSINDFVSLYTTDNSEMKIKDKYQIQSVNPDTLENEMVNITGVLRKKNEYNKLIKIGINGETIKVTPDHVFLIKNENTGEVKEVQAQNLSLNYEIPYTDGSSTKFESVCSLDIIYSMGDVYDIELEKNHYFAANGIVSHNCRLRSDMSELNELNSNLIGGGSTKIGSLGVVTVNFPRLAWKSKDEEDFLDRLRQSVDDVARINNSKRHIIKKRIDKGTLPLYSLGYMDLNQQFLTYGVNGLNECLEILGYSILTEEGKDFALKIIGVINEENSKQQKKYRAPFNCEQTPSENSAIKLAKKDKLLKYNNDEYSIYSNQFIPLTTEANLLDRVDLQGTFDAHFSGGSIMHANVEQELETVEQMEDLIDLCTEKGVIYWAVNYNLQECENGHISVAKGETCPVCGGKIMYNFTRVVGFLTKVASWAKERREEDYPERQFYNL